MFYILHGHRLKYSHSSHLWQFENLWIFGNARTVFGIAITMKYDRLEAINIKYSNETMMRIEWSTQYYSQLSCCDYMRYEAFAIHFIFISYSFQIHHYLDCFEIYHFDESFINKLHWPDEYLIFVKCIDERLCQSAIVNCR